MEAVIEQESHGPFECKCNQIVKVMMDRDISFVCPECKFEIILARNGGKLNFDFLDQDFNWERSVQTLLVAMTNLVNDVRQNYVPKTEYQKLQEKTVFLRGVAMGAKGFKQEDLE